MPPLPLPAGAPGGPIVTLERLVIRGHRSAESWYVQCRPRVNPRPQRVPLAGVPRAAGSGAQALAALGTPVLNDATSADGRHSAAKAMAAFSDKLARLVGAFHGFAPFPVMAVRRPKSSQCRAFIPDCRTSQSEPQTIIAANADAVSPKPCRRRSGHRFEASADRPPRAHPAPLCHRCRCRDPGPDRCRPYRLGSAHPGHCR